MKRLYLLFLIPMLFLASCSNLPENPFNKKPVVTPNITAPVFIDNSTLMAGSFNIQVFGLAKRDKPEVMEVLTIIACEFDIMAIQELRDGTETTASMYLENVNNVCDTHNRKVVVGPRLGRSTSKEQYAIMYNDDTIDFLSSYTYSDPDDLFEREPLIGRFKTGDLTFILVNVHIKPEDARNEIDSMEKVLSDIKKKFPEDENIILMGDFNADCEYYKHGKEVNILETKYTWIVDNTADTTTRASDCAYDRIIVSPAMVTKFTGQWGVFEFDKELNISSEELMFDVSDHYPIWAEFRKR